MELPWQWLLKFQLLRGWHNAPSRAAAVEIFRGQGLSITLSDILTLDPYNQLGSPESDPQGLSSYVIPSLVSLTSNQVFKAWISQTCSK